MTDYCVIYEDPLEPDAPAKILHPAPEWMEFAMAGGLPPISVFWNLQRDEENAIAEGRHETFEHDPDKYKLQWEAERIGPLTEEEAIEYLIMKDIPMRVWGIEYNRPMFKIVKREQVPSDRTFRNAWRLAL